MGRRRGRECPSSLPRQFAPAQAKRGREGKNPRWKKFLRKSYTKKKDSGVSGSGPHGIAVVHSGEGEKKKDDARRVKEIL